MREIMYDAIYKNEKTHWWYCARREIVLSLLDLSLENMRKLKMIDFGCGTGAMLETLSEFGEVTGVDFSDKALEYCKSKFDGKLLQVNLNEKILLEDKYDIAVAMDVLEHLDDDYTGLCNMKNALINGGNLIITVPAFMFMWSAHDDNNFHKRRYTAKNLKQLLLKAGFEIKYLSYYNFWIFPIVAFLRVFFNLFKFNKNSEAENKKSNKFVNGLLYRIFKSEKLFVSRNISLPFGVSLITVAKKPNL